MIKFIQKALSRLVSDGPIQFLHSVKLYIKHLKKRLKWSTAFVRLKFQILHRCNGYKAIPDPFKVIYISPREINRYSSKFKAWEGIGKILGGDWDKKARPIEEFTKYQAVKKHFCYGVSWEETGIIDHLLRRLSEEKRTNIDGCRNREELIDRYNGIDELYEDLKNEGYQEKKNHRMDYISVHIARDGEFIFDRNGCHRLSVAKILNLKKIPVSVRARHKEWQKIRDKVYVADTVEILEKQTKSYLNHPDIEYIIRRNNRSIY
jgi:hypothetical protein